MATPITLNNYLFKIHHICHHPTNTHLDKTIIINPRRRASRNSSLNLQLFNSKHCYYQPLPFRVNYGDADAVSGEPPSPVSDVDQLVTSFSSTSENYVPVLIRMLGLDNDPLDREQAIVALWKYSLGGKHYVDNIMQFRGCLNLTVNLLTSQSVNACEAAAGLLRMISSVNAYRDIVSECGAIEEATALLRRPSLASEVKEQSICMLWNLSADEKQRLKIANSSLLPLLVKCLDDEDMKVIEAAGGVLSNLALSPCNHSLMVEADVIPKLAKFLTKEREGSKVINKESRNVLLELAKDDYNKILIMEEELVFVPLVGAAAYASFKPALHSWPSLPDGTEFRRSSNVPSRYGASELLLGLNVEDNTAKIDESKMEAIVGRTQQQFLARIGAIENENARKSDGGSPTNSHHTLLPWKDGVARLVLILELEDETAITRAADAICAASINETLRISFKEAGAVKRLVHLLCHNNNAVQSAVMDALEKLSVSNRLCETLEAEGITHILVNMLKDSQTPDQLLEKTLGILARIWDLHKQMKLKLYNSPVNGSSKIFNSVSSSRISTRENNVVEKENMMDFALVSRLADILRSGSTDLQSKVASVLEYVIMSEPCMDSSIARDLESGLLTVFSQYAPKALKADIEDQEPNLVFLEEAGVAVSAASRLLTKLLDYSQFSGTLDSNHFTKLLRQILKSDIPLHYKDWVGACLVRLSFFSSPFEESIISEVTLYETIPRLIEQIKTSSASGQEAAVVELHRIISEGVVGATQSVASHGGIFPLVKVIELGSDTAVEAGLAVLYNLSMDSENHAAILSAGAVPLLSRIVHSQKPQSMRALHLLRNLPV